MRRAVSRPSRVPMPKALIAVPAVLGLAVPLAFYVATRPPAATPEERFAEALELLDRPDTPRTRNAARRLAEKLADEGYRSPGFGGGTDFVIGMTALRDAVDRDLVAGRPYYVRAVRALLRAEQQALVDERRGQWEYAVGLALARLDEHDAAEPHLRAALRGGLAGREDVGYELVRVMLSQADKPPGDEILALARGLADDVVADPADPDRALRLLIRVLLRRGRPELAWLRLPELEYPDADEAKLLAARVEIGRGRDERALPLLGPLAGDYGVAPSVAARASLLAGRIRVARGENAEAAGLLDKLARNHGETEEAAAAALLLGGLMQDAGRHEEALYWFRTLLERFAPDEADPDGLGRFRNRWVARDEVAAAVETAWERWVGGGRVTEAEMLATAAEPALGVRRSARLVAETHRETVERAVADAEGRGATAMEEARDRLAALRLRSGRAFARLADLVGDEAVAAEAHREAAADLAAAGEPGEALTQIDAFLAAAPDGLVASGELARAEILMDLGDFEAAAAQLDRVLELRRDDPVVFGAKLLAGRVARERGDVAAAERYWAGLVESGELKPTAAEWRSALYELGLLREQLAARTERAGPDAVPDPSAVAGPAEDADAREESARLWDAAVATLDEFVRRYPEDPRALRARMLAAAAARRRAGVARLQLEDAETDNVRRRLERLAVAHLDDAERGLATLLPELSAREDRRDLPRADRVLLRGAYFEYAHVLLDLGRPDDAIVAYGVAINRYPDDPLVFTAYLRMAEAHRRAGRDLEARAVLGQARVILRRMDDDAFDGRSSNYRREEWSDWLAHAAN